MLPPVWDLGDHNLFPQLVAYNIPPLAQNKGMNNDEKRGLLLTAGH